MVFELAITHEDVQELKTVFDDRYVLQSDCNEKQENVNKKFANDDKRIDTLIGRMNLWNKRRLFLLGKQKMILCNRDKFL